RIRTAIISSFVRLTIFLRYQRDTILLVGFFPTHDDLLRVDGVHLYPNVIRLYRQLPKKTPVYQDHELDLGRASERLDGIHRRPDRTPCPQHIIHQNDLFALHYKIDIGTAGHQRATAFAPEIITKEGDIKLAVRD